MTKERGYTGPTELFAYVGEHEGKEIDRSYFTARDQPNAILAGIERTVMKERGLAFGQATFRFLSHSDIIEPARVQGNGDGRFYVDGRHPIIDYSDRPTKIYNAPDHSGLKSTYEMKG